MPTVLLATARDVADHDTDLKLIEDALLGLGIDAGSSPWDADADWTGADLVVIRSTWDYVERHDEFLAWCRRVDQVGNVANPASVVEWNSHKGYLVGLAAGGVPVVPTRLVHVGERLDLRSEYPADQTLVVKPAVSAGSRDTVRGRADEVQDHADRLSDGVDILVQPFVPEITTEGERSLVYFGGAYSHAVRKVPKTGDYRVQFQFGGSDEPYRPTDAEMELAAGALSAVAADLLYARVDMVPTADGPALMELELIEPAVFLDADPDAVDRFAAAIADRVQHRTSH